MANPPPGIEKVIGMIRRLGRRTEHPKDPKSTFLDASIDVEEAGLALNSTQLKYPDIDHFDLTQVCDGHQIDDKISDIDIISSINEIDNSVDVQSTRDVPRVVTICPCSNRSVESCKLNSSSISKILNGRLDQALKLPSHHHGLFGLPLDSWEAQGCGQMFALIQ